MSNAGRLSDAGRASDANRRQTSQSSGSGAATSASYPDGGGDDATKPKTYRGVYRCGGQKHGLFEARLWTFKPETGRKQRTVGPYKSRMMAAIAFDDEAREAKRPWIDLNDHGPQDKEDGAEVLGSEQKGVKWDPVAGAWRAEMEVYNRLHPEWIGQAPLEQTAARMYDRECRKKGKRNANIAESQVSVKTHYLTGLPIKPKTYTYHGDEQRKMERRKAAMNLKMRKATEAAVFLPDPIKERKKRATAYSYL